MSFPLTVKQRMPCVHWNHFPISQTTENVANGAGALPTPGVEMAKLDKQLTDPEQYYYCCPICHSSNQKPENNPSSKGHE